MADKAYIVANKEQELEILKKFEQNGFAWLPGDNPTDWLPSKSVSFENFPYVLIEKGYIAWSSTLRSKYRKIVYDGRKEEKMDNKYKVTQEFMNELIEWRDDFNLNTKAGDGYAFVDGHDFQNIPDVIDIWWTDPDNPTENNNRMIAIIKWLNGEDVFEVEKPHTFVVRSDKHDRDGDYTYVQIENDMTTTAYTFDSATKFDTREETQGWANSHQVVVEIDEEGNEVE